MCFTISKKPWKFLLFLYLGMLASVQPIHSPQQQVAYILGLWLEAATGRLKLAMFLFQPIPFSVGSSNTQGTVTTFSPADYPTSSGQDISPVALLLRSVVKEYNKSVKTVLFGEDVRDVTIKFEDQTSLTAHFPDLTNQESHKFGK